MIYKTKNTHKKIHKPSINKIKIIFTPKNNQQNINILFIRYFPYF